MSFGDSREFYDLSKASRDQLKDIMFVRKALATNPDNVKYVPKEIYKKICKIEEAKRKLAMKNAKGAIKYKLAFLKTMRLIANGNEDALVIAPEYIKNVENIVLAAIDKFGSVQLKNAGEQLRVDEKFTLKVIKTHPSAALRPVGLCPEAARPALRRYAPALRPHSHHGHQAENSPAG